jgi:hypothetical protein
MRRAAGKAVDAVGGPKAIITGIGLTAGGLGALWLQDYHHEKDMEQEENHHNETIVQSESSS